MKLPIIPGRGLSSKKALALRYDFMIKQGLYFEELEQNSLSLYDIQNKIEHYIGSVELPLGLVGPLVFEDNDEKEIVFTALGTLEGALIASINRGAKALSLSGGVRAEVLRQRMSRAPTFIFETEAESQSFASFCTTKFEAICNLIKQYSNHAELLYIRPISDKHILHLKFVYETGDAAGQNMTTICSWHAILWLLDQFEDSFQIRPIDFVLEGNGASDKKVSQINIEEGRGIDVVATAFLSTKVMQDVLRTSPKQMLRFWEPSRQLAKKDGMLGYNINVANSIAAFFVATGQDLASIHESGLGFLELQAAEGGLKLELRLPNLVIGTVGGGTQIPKQAQILKMMGCSGSGKVKRFAKLIASFALGLEISTYAAMVSGEFAKAHEMLGRNRPVNWLVRHELTPAFFKDKLNISEDSTINTYEKDHLENGILTSITSRISKKVIGFIPLQLIEKDGSITEILLKSKALDSEVIKGLHRMAASINVKLADLFKKYKTQIEYHNSHLKELEIYRLLGEKKFKHMPEYKGQYQEANREIYLLFQNYISPKSCRLYNSENYPELWNKADILKAIDSIHEFHQLDLEAKTVQSFKPWESFELYETLYKLMLQDTNNAQEEKILQDFHTDCHHLEEEAAHIKFPRMLIHNDFNPRNILVQNDGQLKIYDWELAVRDLPHRDIIEFLSFVITEKDSDEQIWEYLHYYQQYYPKYDWAEFQKAYLYSSKVLILTRLSFYEVAGILIKYSFSQRVLKTALRIYNLLKA